MRGRDAIGVAVRGPDGQIFAAQEPLNSILHRNRFARAPFFRGVVVLYETLVIGTRWLMRSGSLAAAGEGVAIGGGALALTLLFTIGLAIGLFVLLPLLRRPGRRLAHARRGQRRSAGRSSSTSSRACIRVAIFVGYLLLVSRSAEIRRVFQYHGAEHMTIHALEHERAADGRERAPLPDGASALRHRVPGRLHHRQHPALQPARRRGAVGQHPRPHPAHPGHRGGRRTSCSAGAPSAASTGAVRWLFLPGIWLQAHHHQAARRLDDRGRHRLDAGGAGRQRRGARRRAAWIPSASPSPTPRRAGARRRRGAARAARRAAVLADRGPTRRAHEPRGSARRDRARLAEIEAEWSRPEVAADPERSRTLGREQAQLAPVVDELSAPARRPRAARRGAPRPRGRDRPGAARAGARGRRRARRPRRSSSSRRLRVQLLPRDPNDDRDVIIEIRAGTGGEEAALFAAELFRMYVRYAERHRWKTEAALGQRDRHRRAPRGHLRDPRAGRLQPPQVRGRRAPRPARARDRVERPHPHLDRDRRGAARRPTRSRSRSTRTRTCASTSSARPGPAARASTRPTRRSASRTCRPASWSRSRTRRASTRTRPRRWPCCGAAARAGAAQGARGRGRRAPLAWSAPASAPRRSGPTTSPRTASRTIASSMDLHNLPSVLDGDLDRLIDALITDRPGRAPGVLRRQPVPALARAGRPTVPTTAADRAARRRAGLAATRSATATRATPRRDCRRAARRRRASTPSCSSATSWASTGRRSSAHPEAPLGDGQAASFEALVVRRASGRAGRLHPRPQGVLRRRLRVDRGCSSRAPRPRRSSTWRSSASAPTLTSAPRAGGRRAVPRLGRGHGQRRHRRRHRLELRRRRYGDAVRFHLSATSPPRPSPSRSRTPSPTASPTSWTFASGDLCDVAAVAASGRPARGQPALRPRRRSCPDLPVAASFEPVARARRRPGRAGGHPPAAAGAAGRPRRPAAPRCSRSAPTRPTLGPGRGRRSAAATGAARVRPGPLGRAARRGASDRRGCADGPPAVLPASRTETRIDRAVAAMARRRGIVGLPTETVYGVAVLPARGPLRALIAAKGRPPDKGIAVLIDEPRPGRAGSSVMPTRGRAARERFWPGALTLVLRPAP